MNSAKKMKLKKLIVAVAPSAGRTIGEPSTKRRPATTCPFVASSVGGSTGEIRPRKNAEARNEHASTTSVTGAVITCTSTPPTLGPPTNESARLPFTIDSPSMKRSRGTSETKSVLYETWKSTASDPTRNATTSMWPKVSASKA